MKKESRQQVALANEMPLFIHSFFSFIAHIHFEGRLSGKIKIIQKQVVVGWSLIGALPSLRRLLAVLVTHKICYRPTEWRVASFLV